MSAYRVCDTCDKPRPPQQYETEGDTTCLRCLGWKRCTKCRVVRELSMFTVGRTAANGRKYKRAACIICERAAQIARRSDDHGRALKREQRRRRNARLKNALRYPRSASSSGPRGAAHSEMVAAPGGRAYGNGSGPPGAAHSEMVAAPGGRATNQVAAPGGRAYGDGSGPRGPLPVAVPTVSQLNAAEVANLSTKATRGPTASGHDPADYPGFDPAAFDLPGFDPLDMSTWPEEAL